MDTGSGGGSGGTGSSSAGGMYDPHRVAAAAAAAAHHSPHMNHAAAVAAAMHPYHAASVAAANHVSPAALTANHVMGPAVPDVHKRDKDAIYGYVLYIFNLFNADGLRTVENINLYFDGMTRYTLLDIAISVTLKYLNVEMSIGFEGSDIVRHKM